MAGYSPYGLIYKAKVVSKLPFLKNVITKEEADALLEENNTKYGPIMQAAWEYNIPVYRVGGVYYSPELISKQLIPLSKSTTDNIVTPGNNF